MVAIADRARGPAVEGEPRLAGVAEHELAVGVVVAGDAGGEDGDREGAVAVVDDRAVPELNGDQKRATSLHDDLLLCDDPDNR